MRLMKKKSKVDLAEIDAKMKNAFSRIKEEIEDHKDTINQNTNEIQANYEFLCKLESKIDKLSERIDEVSMFITRLRDDRNEENNYNVQKLTLREQEVFVVIYTSEKDLTYKEIGRRTGLTENLVSGYVTNLITKGVPLIKRYTNNVANISLDHDFKAVQTKENILRISSEIGSDIEY